MTILIRALVLVGSVLLISAAERSTVLNTNLRDASTYGSANGRHVEQHASEPTANISTIYLVSSCHLDVGFADTSANIVNRYFDHFFPLAIEVAQQLQEEGGQEQLVFTTHTFLVHLYNNCLPELGLHCPNEQQLKNFTDAVQKGYITWHAFPFNSQMEFYDSSMVDFGFSATHVLDAYFNTKKKITMSQRDVPGTTRSLIPIMKRNDIEAITVGVNGASMPPAVPSAFVWNDPVSDSSVIAMWHPHGYGGSSGPGLDSMVIVPGMEQALAFAIRGDNSGPPGVDEVKRNFATLNALFPGAKIVASGYDAFVEHLVNFKSQLPVYTDEMGDTWIHGVPSDPWKTAVNREMSRLRTKCLASGQCSLDDPSFDSFSWMMLKNGEHTWGKDVKTYLHDIKNWSNEQFHSVVNLSNFQDMIKSWIEQRNWGIDTAIAQLKDDNPLKKSIENSIEEMSFDGEISTDGFKQVSNVSSIFECGGLSLSFSSDTSGIDFFADKRTAGKAIQYASQSNQIASPLYQAFTSSDYMTFMKEYFYSYPSFAFLDFGKPGYSGTQEIKVSPALKALWFKDGTGSCEFLTQSQFDSNIVTDYGGPQSLWLRTTVPKVTSPQESVEVEFTVYIVNKTSTRIPESLSFQFNPPVNNASSMHISKLGEYFRVLEVMKNGSKHLHASDRGVAYMDSNLTFQALDTSVICVGEPTAFPTPMEQPDVTKGFAFNIYNNIWGTNYIMWYPFLQQDASSKYHFVMTLPPSK